MILPDRPCARVLTVFTTALLAACGPSLQESAPAASPEPNLGAPSPAPGVAPTAAVTTSAPAPSSAPAPAGPDLVILSVTNASAVPRPQETVSLVEADLKKFAPNLELAHSLVLDSNGAVVLSQIIAGATASELVFQTDLRAGETKTFKIRSGERKLAPFSAYRVYGRFVRERKDDFAWENDLVAHRVYGPALETDKKEPLVSSGIDTWSKRTPRLLVNEWYQTDDYHADHGDGADFYSVGKTRGCGGLGIWNNDKLHVSRNFTTSRVIANGPIRLIFELDYAPWDIGGNKVTETKRVTLDAGSPFNHIESKFTTKKPTLDVALGIAKHPGAALTTDTQAVALRSWEPINAGKDGNLGCAVVLAAGAKGVEKQTEDTALLVTTAKASEPVHYYVGSTWDRAGRVTSAGAWAEATRQLAARLATPIQLALSAGPGATPPAAPPAPATAPAAPAAPKPLAAAPTPAAAPAPATVPAAAAPAKAAPGATKAPAPKAPAPATAKASAPVASASTTAPAAPPVVTPVAPATAKTAAPPATKPVSGP